MSPSGDVCPSCGANARNYGSGRQQQQQQQVAYVKTLSSGNRPIFATVLSGLAVVGAVGAFLLAASYNFLPSMSALTQFSSSFSGFASFMPYFLALVGIASIVAAYGFLKGNHWAWKVGLIASVLEVITIITPNLLGLAVGIVSIYFLTTKPVKSWLRK